MKTILNFIFVASLVALIFLPMTAATSTTTRTIPCPGGGNSTHVITYDDESSRVLSITTTNCAGVSKTVTYHYADGITTTYTPSGGSFTVTGSNFEISVNATVEIVSVVTGNVVYTYSGTLSANTSTAIYSGLGSGVYLLVARNPSNYSSVYAVYGFYQ